MYHNQVPSIRVVKKGPEYDAWLVKRNAEMAEKEEEEDGSQNSNDEDEEVEVVTGTMPKNSMDMLTKMVGMTSEKEMRAYLGSARVTADGLFSIIDVIMKLYGCSRQAAKKSGTI